MNEIFGRAFSAGLLVAMGALIVYQIFMLWWTNKTAGSLPMPIKVLRGVNIVLLTAGTVLIVLQMMKG